MFFNKHEVVKHLSCSSSFSGQDSWREVTKDLACKQDSLLKGLLAPSLWWKISRQHFSENQLSCSQGAGIQRNIVVETACQNAFQHNLFEKFPNYKSAWKPNFYGRFEFEFSFKGSFPRNFPARDPFREILQLFLEKHLLFLRIHTNCSAWMLLPASFSGRFLRKKNSVKKVFGRFHVETFFQRMHPARKLLRRSIVKGKLSVCKLLSCPCRIMQEEVFSWNKVCIADKTKENIHIPEWNHALSDFSFRDKMRHAIGLIGQHVAAMQHRQIDWKASSGSVTDQILLNLPVQIKIKRLYPLRAVG